jgi:hypothetical protein
MITVLGFTVALFIPELAYSDPDLTGHAKMGVLAASAIAAAAILNTANKRNDWSVAGGRDGCRPPDICRSGPAWCSLLRGHMSSRTR